MVTLMDGGMGRELARRGASTRTGLWSAQALIDAPEVVVDTHKDFIAAGARIITTNSYSCVPSYLGKAAQADRYLELAALSGKLARRAVEESGEEVRIAGGLPPLSESYRADMVLDDDVARPIYAALAEALEPHVDLFLCETMSSIRESRNAAMEAKAVSNGKPVFVSWTLKEEPGAGLRSGESVADAFNAVSDLDLVGYLFNCTHPDAIEAAIGVITGLTDRPTGGCPNRFDVPVGFTLDNEVRVQERKDFGPEHFVEAAQRCVNRGATLFGGCCGIGPEHIAALRAGVLSAL